MINITNMSFNFGDLKVDNNYKPTKTGGFNFGDLENVVQQKQAEQQRQQKQDIYNQSVAQQYQQQAQEAGSFGGLFRNTLAGLNPFSSEGRGNIAQGIENVGQAVVHPVETAKKVGGVFFGPSIETYKNLTQARKDRETLKRIEDNNKVANLYANERRKHPELSGVYDEKMRKIYNENKELASEMGGELKNKTEEQLVGQTFGTLLDIAQIIPIGSLLSSGVKFATSEGVKLGAKEIAKLLADEGIDAGTKEAGQFLAGRGITVAKESLPKLLGKSMLEGGAWGGSYGLAGGLEQNKSIKEAGKEALKGAGLGFVLAPALTLAGVGLGKAFKRGTPENKKLVDETVIELEKMTNKKATKEDKDILAHSFEVGVKKEDIVKNIKEEGKKSVSKATSKEKGIKTIPKAEKPTATKIPKEIQKAKAEGKSFDDWWKNKKIKNANIPDSFNFNSPNANKYYFGNNTQKFLEKSRENNVSEIKMPSNSIVHRGERSGKNVFGNWFSADRGEAEGYAGAGVVRSLDVSGKKFATYDRYLKDEPTQLDRNEIKNGLSRAIKDGYDGIYNTGDNSLLIPTKSQLKELWDKTKPAEAKIPKEYESAEEVLKTQIGETFKKVEPVGDLWKSKGSVIFIEPLRDKIGFASWLRKQNFVNKADEAGNGIYRVDVKVQEINAETGKKGTSIKQKEVPVEDVTKFYEPKKEPPKLEIGKTPSKVAKSIEAKAIEKRLTTGFKNLAGYNKKTVAGQAKKVAEIINQGEDVISQHLSGEKPLPEDVNEGAFITGVKEYLTEYPSRKLFEEFANSPLVSETSKAAQTMRFLREREPDSADAIIIEAKKARLERAKRLGKDVEKNKKLIKNRLKPKLKVAKAQELLNNLIC